MRPTILSGLPWLAFLSVVYWLRTRAPRASSVGKPAEAPEE
jgi:hypothetical protein